MQYPASAQAQENTSERTSQGTTYVLDSLKSLEGERGGLTIVAKSGAPCRVRLVGSETRHGDVRLLRLVPLVLGPGFGEVWNDG
jgi:hypothetical protein